MLLNVRLPDHIGIGLDNSLCKGCTAREFLDNSPIKQHVKDMSKNVPVPQPSVLTIPASSTPLQASILTTPVSPAISTITQPQSLNPASSSSVLKPLSESTSFQAMGASIPPIQPTATASVESPIPFTTPAILPIRSQNGHSAVFKTDGNIGKSLVVCLGIGALVGCVLYYLRSKMRAQDAEDLDTEEGQDTDEPNRSQNEMA